MNSSNKIFSVSALALGVSLLAAVSTAQAVTAQRTIVVNPTGACQSALPVFDGNIRKRAKAVQNDGTNSAFVTCSFYSQSTVDTAGDPRSISVAASTKGGAPINITCTAIVGEEGTNFPISPKNLLLPADGTTKVMTWTDADFGGVFGAPLPSPLFSMLCELPISVGINNSKISYMEDIGN